MRRKHSKKMTHAKSGNGSMVYLSREEIVKEIDEGAREYRGMSGKKMLKAYRQGKLMNPGEVAPFLMLANLLKKDDPIFA